ncbi:hypothetical protein HY489_01190 [Candidatus Woesearchaeota archaeon]|nr:hypothetical protein [Candidatus Woesearchaeota archaeon]
MALILALVMNEQSKTADDVHADIYLINTEAVTLVVRTKADFTQTVNEKTGASITVGPKPAELELKPNSATKVGNIIEWELDFALWFDVWHKKKTDKNFTVSSYHLKGTKQEQVLPVLNKKGLVVQPSVTREESF